MCIQKRCCLLWGALFASGLLLQTATAQPATVPTQQPTATVAQPYQQAEISTQKTDQPRLYGSSFFDQAASLESMLAFGSGLFPADYWLGPGDRLGIYLLGKTQQSFDVIVNVEGKIFIPTVGMFQVSGMSIQGFRKFLQRELTKYFDNFTVEVMLIEPRRFPVIVAGDVKQPGKYYLSSIHTVLDAIIAAGGPGSNGSLRNIEVYREDSLRCVVDLYQFLMKGITTNDLFLQPHDKILTPLIRDVVTVTGEVKRPARFELKADGNEKISDVIELAGNFNELAYLDKIEISRLLPNGERTVQYINYRQILSDDSSASDFVLKNGDRIHVFSILEQTYPKFVFIHGEVKKPGQYEFEENLRVSDLLLKAGNLTRSAYVLEGEVAKVAPKQPTRFIKLDIQKIMQNPDCRENLVLEQDDRVFIRRIPEWEVGAVVELKGEVMFPGLYAITEDSTRLSEIIEKAGGFTDKAMIRESALIRQSSKITIDKEYMRLKQIPRDQLTKTEYEYLVMKENTQDIGRIVVDFYRLCVEHDDSEDVTLKDGDFINVPEAPNLVYVTGRVSRPGGVLFEPGKDIRYYLKKAGGATWDAKKSSIKVTKVTGEILDEKKIRRFEPGDIIWVPRKPDRDWWEIFRQTIAVIAQVATVYLVVERALSDK
ncbi:MAG TPA: hypothetical protein ENN22_04715 [bacterium]|nr:hypothetical protein [bacterium]